MDGRIESRMKLLSIPAVQFSAGQSQSSSSVVVDGVIDKIEEHCKQPEVRGWV